MTSSSRATGRARPFMIVDGPLQPRRPFGVGIEPQIGDARKPGAHRLGMRPQQVRVDAHPDAEHQPLALGLGLDRLGRELRLGRDERHLGGNRDVRIGIEHDARIGPDLGPSRFKVGR